MIYDDMVIGFSIFKKYEPTFEEQILTVGPEGGELCACRVAPDRMDPVEREQLENSRWRWKSGAGIWRHHV